MGLELRVTALLEKDVAVNSEIAVSEQSGWLSTELQEEASSRQIAEIPTSPYEIVKDFFNWQFEIGAIDFIVVCAIYEVPLLKFMRPNRLNWPQVILGPDKETLNQELLVRMALRGFQLIVATTSIVNEILDFLRAIVTNRWETHFFLLAKNTICLELHGILMD